MWISAVTAQITFDYSFKEHLNMFYTHSFSVRSPAPVCAAQSTKKCFFFFTPVIKSRIFVNSPSMNTSRMQHDSQMSLYGLLTFNRYSSPILISNLMPNIFIFVFLLFFYYSPKSASERK